MKTNTSSDKGHGGRRPGAGRPLTGDEPRKNRSIRFTDAEWQFVANQAARVGLSTSEYIRRKVLNS